MQYLAYCQLVLLLLVILFCIYLLIISIDNKKNLKEIQELLRDIQDNKNSKIQKKNKEINKQDKGNRNELKFRAENNNYTPFNSKQNDLKYFNVETCRNLSSGNYFIILEEHNKNFSKMVIPTGEIKNLENKLFGDIEVSSLEYLLENHLISESQINSYFNFITDNESFTNNIYYKNNKICKSIKDIISN